nr:hypothetical protein Iba_scaffold7681CG0040 [Ipomoea batatas]
MERNTGHDLEENERPRDEEDVEQARRLWRIPNVHQDDPEYTQNIRGSSKTTTPSATFLDYHSTSKCLLLIETLPNRTSGEETVKF